MKLTKEDYMRLPKERLAELLAEMDNVPAIPAEPIQPVAPVNPLNVPWTTPGYPLWPWPAISYANTASAEKE